MTTQLSPIDELEYETGSPDRSPKKRHHRYTDEEEEEEEDTDYEKDEAAKQPQSPLPPLPQSPPPAADQTGHRRAREAYIHYRTQQLRNVARNKFQRCRTDIQYLAMEYARWRQALALQASVAKKTADAFRKALSATVRSTKLHMNSVFPHASFRCSGEDTGGGKGIHEAQYTDMVRELAQIEKGVHPHLQHADEIGTSKDSVHGNMIAVEDPLVSAWLGIKTVDDMKATATAAAAAAAAAPSPFTSDETLKTMNAARDDLMAKTDGTFLNSLTMQNYHELARTFVTKVSEKTGQLALQQGNRDDISMHPYEIFCLLQDPTSKSVGYSYWVENYKDNEKWWLENRVKAVYRTNTELARPDMYSSSSSKKARGGKSPLPPPPPPPPPAAAAAAAAAAAGTAGAAAGGGEKSNHQVKRKKPQQQKAPERHRPRVEVPPAAAAAALVKKKRKAPPPIGSRIKQKINDNNKKVRWEDHPEYRRGNSREDDTGYRYARPQSTFSSDDENDIQ